MASTGEGRKQQFASAADGNAPLKYPSFKSPPKPSLTDTVIDVSPEEEEETAFPLREDRPLVQDVCTISVLPDEGNTVPQCTSSQFTLLSFVKALLPCKNQMFIDAQLNCQKTQNRINVLLGGTDSYQSCVVDINVEKGNGGEAHDGGVVGNVKSESVIKLSPRDAMMHQPTGGEDTSVPLHLILGKSSSCSPSYDLAVSCLALVSRSDHAALFLVSKRIGTLVASPELYKGSISLRSYRGVPLRVPKSTPSWFILRREKIQTATTTLIPIPSFPSQPQTFSSFVALDWGIYVIGGFKNTDVRTPDVLLLDCRNNTWRELPPMAVGRAAAAAGVVGEEVVSSNWAEVFDPKTNTWETLAPMQDRNEGDNVIRDTLVMDEKLHAVEFWSGGCSLQYSPREGEWGRKKRSIAW
ncbi:unnamed protein product [Brassica oleracea]